MQANRQPTTAVCHAHFDTKESPPVTAALSYRFATSGLPSGVEIIGGHGIHIATVGRNNEKQTMQNKLIEGCKGHS